MVRRIAFLVSQGASPENIVAVTFTNRAAREMRERLHAFLGIATQKVFVGTLHLLGLRMIQEITANEWVVFDRKEQENVLKSLIEGSDWKAADLAEKISYAKNLVEEPQDDEIKTILNEYQRILSARKALDFDDLILKPAQLLGDRGWRKKYSERFQHIIVDEYQDINPAQHRLLRLLVGERTNICAVGDPDQAIYAFRGADVSNFIYFGRNFSGTTEVGLELNYRSSGNIVRSSGMMIANNRKRIQKEIRAVKREGSQIVVVSVPDEMAEGEFIVQEIESRVGGLSHYRLENIRNEDEFLDRSFCFSDFAVVFRTNKQAEAIEERLSEAGIPCRVLGRGIMGGRARLHNIISSLQHYADTAENRTNLSGMRAIDFIQSFSVPAFGDDEATQLSNHIKLIFGDGWAETTAQDLIDVLNIMTPADDFDPRADVVTLMTLHMAKGLEFRVVFVSGVEDGLIPYRAGKRLADAEEERRLLYVGMTRARDELFLIHKRRGYLYGKVLDRSPSPFLSEIPEACIHKILIPDKSKRSQRKRQMKLL
jgi:superfamily I DNA/RNA helicase